MFLLKTVAGVVVGRSRTRIFIDGQRFRADDAVWLDPTPASGAFVEDVADPPTVPPVVGMIALTLAMDEAGITEANVDAAINGMPGVGVGPAKTKRQIRSWWAKADAVSRHSPFLATVAGLLSLTPAQVDALFIAAAATNA